MMTTEDQIADAEEKPSTGGNGAERNATAEQQAGKAQTPPFQGRTPPPPGAVGPEAAPAGPAPAEAPPAEPPIDYQDKYLRLQAEFENFRKRMHKEQSEILKYAHLPLLRDLTSVLDNLERAIDHAKDNDNPDQEAFIAGLELVTKQISDLFERFGMFRIKAKGEPFNPARHEAMSVVETDEVPENTVLEEYQAGYSLHERVVRPAMVIVARKPAPPAAKSPEAPGAKKEQGKLSDSKGGEE